MVGAERAIVTRKDECERSMRAGPRIFGRGGCDAVFAFGSDSRCEAVGAGL